MRVRARSVAAATRKAVGRRDWIWQSLFLGAHVLLAVMMPRYSAWGAWHARFALLAGLLLALTTRRWELVACAAAYISGAEVFWRMRRIDVPWEFGKYALILILGVALLRTLRARRPWLGAAFFLLLVPSALLTILSLGPEEARDQLSFNLSGPLSLAVCVLFFSALRLTTRELRWMYACLLGPIVAIGTVAAVNIGRHDSFEFGSSSSWIASGSFGPNQVSAVLGLGIIAAVFWMIVGTGNVPATAALAVLTLFLFRQCAITFSRGGLYMAVGGILAAAFFLAGDRRSRWRLLGGAALVLPILFFVVWPRLEALTSGAIGDRFSSFRTTGRDLLVKADLKTWIENPVLGAGPGLGGKNREALYQSAAAHTEYTRLLAEHGLLGLGALALMAMIAAGNLRRAPTRLDKALAAGMLAYSLLFMAVDGMRLVATSFAFGVSGMRLLLPRRRVIGTPVREPVGPRLASRLAPRVP